MSQVKTVDAKAKKPGKPALRADQILVRPLVTEKNMHRATNNNQYAFEIHPMADKDDVKGAVESLFSVKVLKVRTQNRRGKLRRHRFKASRTAAWKKAVVTLHAENRIDFF